MIPEKRKRDVIGLIEELQKRGSSDLEFVIANIPERRRVAATFAVSEQTVTRKARMILQEKISA